MVLYQNGKHNQLMNVCQCDSQMERMSLTPKEQTDLAKFIYNHGKIFGVEKEKSLFIGLA